MEKENLKEETVVDEGRKPYNILNFQDFVLEEGKKGKNKTKKIKPIVKNRKDFLDNMEDDIVDPNECPQRFIKIREQFIKDELK